MSVRTLSTRVLPSLYEPVTANVAALPEAPVPLVLMAWSDRGLAEIGSAGTRLRAAMTAAAPTVAAPRFNSTGSMMSLLDSAEEQD
jgi:hypothetical protein